MWSPRPKGGCPSCRFLRCLRFRTRGIYLYRVVAEISLLYLRTQTTTVSPSSGPTPRMVPPSNSVVNGSKETVWSVVRIFQLSTTHKYRQPIQPFFVFQIKLLNPIDSSLNYTLEYGPSVIPINFSIFFPRE